MRRSDDRSYFFWLWNLLNWHFAPYFRQIHFPFFLSKIKYLFVKAEQLPWDHFTSCMMWTLSYENKKNVEALFKKDKMFSNIVFQNLTNFKLTHCMTSGIKRVNRQPHKMVKHTQTIRRWIVWVCLTIFWGWRLKG